MSDLTGRDQMSDRTDAHEGLNACPRFACNHGNIIYCWFINIGCTKCLLPKPRGRTPKGETDISPPQGR